MSLSGDHIIIIDDGICDIPGENSAWHEWASASQGRSFVLSGRLEILAVFPEGTVADHPVWKQR